MAAFVALLRAINVMGGGKLPMTHLAGLCAEAGCTDVRTYIASGNAVFRSTAGEAEVRAGLRTRLETYAGRPIGVVVRSAAEMAGVAARNPFADKPGDRVLALFSDEPLPQTPMAGAGSARDEEVRFGERELFIFYPAGQGQSRLRLPAMKAGTARNMNTVARLAKMAAELG